MTGWRLGNVANLLELRWFIQGRELVRATWFLSDLLPYQVNPFSGLRAQNKTRRVPQAIPSVPPEL